MKPPTFAPAYVALFPVLSELAQEKGYALAIHGSVSRDFDLVAIPWTDQACSAADLMATLARRVRAVMSNRDGKGVPLSEPERKPHGRLAWAIPIGAGAVLDLSVMPCGGRPAGPCQAGDSPPGA